MKSFIVKNKAILFFILCAVLALTTSYNAAYGGDKQLTVFWEQAEDDLPDIDHWQLYSSTDSELEFAFWKDEGSIAYTGPGMPLTTSIVITAPDGQETSLWFRMQAVDKNENRSLPSEVQENAPTVIDFKPPVPAVLTGSYDNKTKIVTLSWATDPADTDIVNQKLYKSNVPDGPYTVVDAESMQSPYDYVVQPSDSGKWIYFVIVLTDDDGNFSANSNEVAVKLSMGVPFNVRVTVSTQ